MQTSPDCPNIVNTVRAGRISILCQPRRISAMVALALAGIAFMPAALRAADADTSAENIIQIEGVREWPSKTDPNAKLPWAAGVATYTVFRANKENPELSDGRGWTFNHHTDMAAWSGRLYVGWDSGEQHEDTWPARQLYSMSNDGKTWSAPAELFPQGTSTPLRMYFFKAPNGLMLAIAGLRTGYDKIPERTKEGLVVREIRKDHSLGPVYTLRMAFATYEARAKEDKASIYPPPFYTTSGASDFVEACHELLANHTYLSQQDFGMVMDPADRMSWCMRTDWGKQFPAKEVARFGRAMSFYHRKDGALVGVGKVRWATLSRDEGKTWSEPVMATQLITGNAKVWGQRTADGRYALVYNPHTNDRFPLIVVSGDDGIHFKDMALVNEGNQPQRYPGDNKNLGAQYIRGISEWSSDGSWKDDALWVSYSIAKEDIVVSRIPLPIRPETKNTK